MDDGFLTEFEELTGLRVVLARNAEDEGSLCLPDGQQIPYHRWHILKLLATRAEVLARDSQGDPFITRAAYGKGQVLFVNFPLERMLIHRPDCAEEAFHVIYRDLFAPIWSQKCVISENPHIGLTEHKTDDGAIAVLINYSSVPQPTRLCLHESFVVDKALYGSTDEIPACDALILKLRPNA